jgi:hypothetical protein
MFLDNSSSTQLIEPSIFITEASSTQASIIPPRDSGAEIKAENRKPKALIHSSRVSNDPFSSPLKKVISQTNKTVRRFRFGAVAKDSILRSSGNPFSSYVNHQDSYRTELSRFNSKDQLLKLKDVLNLQVGGLKPETKAEFGLSATSGGFFSPCPRMQNIRNQIDKTTANLLGIPNDFQS